MTREQKIIRASWWAIIGNALLAFLKLGAGFISGSFAVIADGIDSVSDIVSSCGTGCCQNHCQATKY